MRKILTAILIVAIIIVVLLLVSRWIISKVSGNGTFGQGSIIMNANQTEGTIFSGVQDIASVSSDAGDDTIVIEADPGAAYASVSRGDVLRFDGTMLTEGVNYFVTVASLSDRFEVSLVPNGTTVDLASSDGSNMFYRSAPTNTFNVDGLEYITISIDAEEAPSASLKFVGSIQNDGLMNGAPNFYASQSLTNRWDEIYSNDLETSTGVAGATGYTLSATDSHKIYKIYASELKWISAVIDRYASGSFNIRIRGTE